MRKLLALLLLLPSLAFGAAFSSLVEWDIQGGVGAATNGCGFKAGASGTDYSQVGATPHATLTTLAVVGASTSDIMIDTTDYTVATTDVGNIVQVTGGTATAGFYEIQSVTTGITGTQKWTVDRAVGTAAQTVVGAMGGSCAEPNDVMASAVGPVAGNTIHVKSATYSRTTTISLGASGSQSVGAITVVGYVTAHNDITTTCTSGGTCPLLTSATNSVAIITSNGKTAWTFIALRITSTAGTRGNGFVQSSPASNIVFHLVYVSALNGFLAAANVDGILVSRSEIASNTAAGIDSGSVGTTTVIDSWIHGNATYGVRCGSACFISRSVIDHNNTSNAANTPGVMSNGGNAIIIKDSVVSYNTGSNTDGVQFLNNAPLIHYTITNSILYGNGRYNLNVPNTGGGRVLYSNGWGGAGTANTNAAAGTVTTGENPITLTADPFTASGSSNFTLNTTAGGGAALRGVGFPGVLPGTMTGYTDVGPLQTQSTSGSIGGVF